LKFYSGIPDPSARLEIMRALLDGIPHSVSDDCIKSLSQKAHGFVGADLAGVVREAGLRAIRKYTKNLNGVKGDEGNEYFCFKSKL
jgi:AAA family ATPase